MRRQVNPFVYYQVQTQNMPYPTIPPWMDETFSQCYEDVVISQHINAYLARNNINQTTLSFIEIGANHPVCTSASYLFTKTFGIRGILVEPNPKLAEALRKFRPNDIVLEAAVTDNDEPEIEFHISPENEISSADEKFVKDWKNSSLGIQETIKVKTVRINSLLEMVKDVSIVCLSIDIEGLDLRVLKDIDFAKYRPHFITIEPSEHYAPGTTQAIINHMKENDYQLIAMNYVNLIFEDKTKG